MRYLYRIVSSPLDKEDWKLFICPGYPTGAIDTTPHKLEDAIDFYNSTDTNFKYKLQQYPLTQEWTDVDG